MKYWFLLITCLLSFPAIAEPAVAIVPVAPEGWQFLIGSDLKKYAKDGCDTTCFQLGADFNGDGKMDTAAFLKTKDAKTEGVFVFLSKEDGFRTFRLTQGEKLRNRGMRLGIYKPGSHKTACGKGNWKCRKDEPATLELTSPALKYYQEDDASSAYVWTADKGEFKRVWMTK